MSAPISAPPRASELRPSPAALARALRNPLGFLESLAGRDLVRLRLPGRSIHLVCHPLLADEVLRGRPEDFRRDGPAEEWRFGGESLISADGAEYARRRAIVESGFGGDAVARAIDRGATSIEGDTAGWRHGQRVDVDAEAVQLTLSATGHAVLGDDYPDARPATETAFRASRAVFKRLILPAAKLTLSAPLPSNRAYTAARAELDAILDRIADRREANGDPDDDIVSCLLAGRDATGAGLTRVQLRSEVWTYLAQGAPAQILTWTLWQLARHPEIADRVAAEADRAAGEAARGTGSGGPDGHLRATDLRALPLTAAVVSEAIRIHPPVWAIAREVERDTELAGMPLTGGSDLLVSTWTIHHDPRFWPDPWRFDPERWLSGDAGRSPTAFLVLGSGPRACVGRDFSLGICTLAVASIVRRFRLLGAPETVAIDPFPFARPKGGLELTLEHRATTSA